MGLFMFQGLFGSASRGFKSCFRGFQKPFKGVPRDYRNILNILRGHCGRFIRIMKTSEVFQGISRAF